MEQHNETLTHHGVKGMRWGVRRFQNKDGSLTPAGKKRQRNSDDSGGSIKRAKDKVVKASKSAAKAAIEKAKKKVTKENVAKYAQKGAEACAKLAMASMVDDIYYNGANKRIIKETVKQTGRAAITAYKMARGGYDIRWYDK